MAEPAGGAAPIRAPIRVALLDSGVDLLHPGVRGRGSVRAAFRVDAGGVVEEPPGKDQPGHGTGVPAAILDLAPHAELVPVRVFVTEPRCSSAQLLAALRHAASLGAAFVNVSLGLTALDARELLADAVASLRAAG